MSKGNQLALIGTPGHYFNLLECLEQLNIDKKNTTLILFNFSSDTSTNAFFDNQIDKRLWKKVKKIAVWETSRSSIYSVSNIYKLVAYFFSLLQFVINRKFDTVIVNQIDVAYYKLAYNCCSFNRIISLDEGNAIIRFIEERNAKKDQESRFLSLPKSIVFFSSYDIAVQAPDSLIHCNYDYSNKTLQLKEIDEELVIFL